MRALLWASILLGVGVLAHARVELQPCKNNIAPQQQMALGEKAAQQVYQQMPVLPDNSPVTAYVRALGSKLSALAPGYKWSYNFRVVNVADINAFALPGGSIFVNLGTVQAASDEAQLAAVMAHEISHVVLQHSVCNAEKQQRVGMIAGLGQMAAGMVLGGTTGQLAQEGIGLTTGLGFLKMSRGAEQQADLMGVGILYDAGYDPHSMAQFFETLQQKYGKGSAQFLSDHPNPGNRSEYVSKEVATFVARPNYVTDTPAFASIHQNVAGMHAYTSQEVASGAWKQQSPNQTVSAGVNQLNAGGATTPAPSAQATPVSANWKTLQGAGFSLQVPDNWTGAGDKNAAMLAPPGGIGKSANGRGTTLISGFVTDLYRPPQQASFDTALEELVSDVARDNPGVACGGASKVNAANAAAKSIECENRSANNGRGEHEWIVGLQSNAGLRYFVFVAPTPDFPAMKPVFDNILRSISLQ